jgi:DnaJ-class molecular chaperone
MNATTQNEIDRCERCFGTGDDNSMRDPYPPRKILWIACPVCKGTGKKPKAN